MSHIGDEGVPAVTPGFSRMRRTAFITWVFGPTAARTATRAATNDGDPNARLSGPELDMSRVAICLVQKRRMLRLFVMGCRGVGITLGCGMWYVGCGMWDVGWRGTRTAKSLSEDLLLRDVGEELEDVYEEEAPRAC